MFGLRFIEVKAMSIIIIFAEFIVKHRQEGDKRYRFTQGDKLKLEFFNDNHEWQTIAEEGIQEDKDNSSFFGKLEEILPKEDDFGFNWDWSYFRIAAHFFLQGKDSS